jgi:hypothetical protein
MKYRKKTTLNFHPSFTDRRENVYSLFSNIGRPGGIQLQLQFRPPWSREGQSCDGLTTIGSAKAIVFSQIATSPLSNMNSRGLSTDGLTPEPFASISNHSQ